MNSNGPVRLGNPQHSWQIPDSKETVLEQESPFSKKILENNHSSTNPKLTIKKIETTQDDQVELTNGNIPSIFSFVINKRVFTEIKTKLTNLVQLMQKSPNDVSLRTTYIADILRFAFILHKYKEFERENTYINNAEVQVRKIQLLNYFESSTQYSTYLLKAYKGINSLDMNSVRDGLLTLRRAQALSPEDKTIAKEMENVLKFLEDKWTMMKSQGDMDESTYKLLKEDLKQILREDPFKEEFQKNPALFKSVKNAPEAFLTTHSHLRSINDFLARHPDAGRINLPNGVYNTENLKLCISKAKTDPLARSIYLITSDPLLSPFVANLLKDLMIDCPHISILFGNEHDGDTLVKAFEADKTIISSTESIKRGVGTINGHEGKVYRYFIDPQYPIKKLK